MKCPTCKREGYVPAGVYLSGEGVSWANHTGPMFVKSDEKRPPRKGEWYLSGAIPTAYRAPNDLSTSYIILKPFTGAT